MRLHPSCSSGKWSQEQKLNSSFFFYRTGWPGWEGSHHDHWSRPHLHSSPDILPGCNGVLGKTSCLHQCCALFKWKGNCKWKVLKRGSPQILDNRDFTQMESVFQNTSCLMLQPPQSLPSRGPLASSDAFTTACWDHKTLSHHWWTLLPTAIAWGWQSEDPLRVLVLFSHHVGSQGTT